MKNEILLSAAQLNNLIHQGDCLVVDCRFDFADAGKGRSDWLAGHVPGAVYAHLDDHLAAPVQPHTGRHPLPAAETFAEFLASLGWSGDQLLVAYDGGSNAIAARLWWMMRYFGQSAALLDGGFQEWSRAGFAIERGEAVGKLSPRENLTGNPRMTASADYIGECLGSERAVVLDARAAERYSGEVEPLDSRGGHIPGALNRPFTENLDASGRFKQPLALRAEFQSFLGNTKPAKVIHSCGSGVTACHNLFAMQLAGLETSLLYPGSWSHWIRDPARPVAIGAEP